MKFEDGVDEDKDGKRRGVGAKRGRMGARTGRRPGAGMGVLLGRRGPGAQCVWVEDGRDSKPWRTTFTFGVVGTYSVHGLDGGKLHRALVSSSLRDTVTVHIWRRRFSQWPNQSEVSHQRHCAGTSNRCRPESFPSRCNVACRERADSLFLPVASYDPEHSPCHCVRASSF